MNKIILTKNLKCWVAAIYDNGILVIEAPTPFTPNATFEQVSESLKLKNPNHNIEKGN